MLRFLWGVFFLIGPCIIKEWLDIQAIILGWGSSFKCFLNDIAGWVGTFGLARGVDIVYEIIVEVS